MKIFIIFALFLLASLLPILFVPLLAITLIALSILAPDLLSHHVWGTTEEDKEEEARHAHH